MDEVLSQAADMKDNNTRATYITSYCNDKQTRAFKDAKQLLNDVIWNENTNSNTIKIKTNPDTHELTGEKVVVPPMEVKLDASAYGSIPQAK